MKIMPNEDWTVHVVGMLHKYRLKTSELADNTIDPRTGKSMSHSYLSTVLNGKKRFASEAAAALTRDRILVALDKLIQEQEIVEAVDPDELRYKQD